MSNPPRARMFKKIRIANVPFNQATSPSSGMIKFAMESFQNQNQRTPIGKVPRPSCVIFSGLRSRHRLRPVLKRHLRYYGGH